MVALMTQYISVCSGIEAASVAFHPLGWKPLAFSEIEAFPSAVLAHHYPTVPNLGDMTKWASWSTALLAQADILVGGPPCFTAGQLVLTEHGYKPIEALIVGDQVLTHEGRLKPVLRIGNKVSSVGKLTMVGRPDGVICTPEHPFLSVNWRNQNTKRGVSNGLGIGQPTDPCPTLDTGGNHAVAIQGSMIGREDKNGPQGDGLNEEVSFTLNCVDRHAVAFAQNTRDEVREMAIVGALAASPGMKQTSYIREQMQVRRLTPTECEALQGFPRNWTDVPFRNKPAADGPRYKSLGNSMAVPCMLWLGQRIQKVLK